jgi:1,4-alpha-glucan branching enzyme
VKKHYCLLHLALLLPLAMLNAQVISTTPATLTTDYAGEVTVLFDAAQGSKGLQGFTGEVYAHTGVITSASSSSSDWKHAPTWGNNAAKYKLSSLGDNKWQLLITPNIQAYYGLSAGEVVKKLAFVFRSADNSKEGKEVGGADIFVDVVEPQLRAKIELPSQPLTVVAKNTRLAIKATSLQSQSLSLLVNHSLLCTTGATSLDTAFIFVQAGDNVIVAEASDGAEIARDSVSVFVADTTASELMPAGLQYGISYDDNDPTTATLVLFAPYKNSVFVLGDFNGWRPHTSYQMKADNGCFWLKLTNLEAGKEYAYQYLIDGSLTVADAYSEKILDPWNDGYITSSTYPNLKPYPTGQTTGIVSVLQTAQQPYAWAVDSFAKPAQERLAVYELLVRDFTAAHTYRAIIDSLHYLRTLGINAIELLPVNEFEGNESWGYNPSFYFAPDKYYGPKNELKRLVDSCHANGIAVIVDLVLNHSFGLSPMVQMYWNSAADCPAANSPWFNVSSPNLDYYWGSDFNHQSPHTQKFVDRVNRFWLQEYRADGIRFDFTKGFTNTAGNGWAYDSQRIGILKRMADSIRAHAPEAYIIFEHLSDNAEEKELADYGIMLWGNVNDQACEAIMGYASNLTAASYKSKAWSKPHLVAYMESHDEERMMYKAAQWGKVEGSYSAKTPERAMERAALCATIFFAIPGPKMIWQFGELGYDYSINACTDGTVGDCRTDNKAIRWDYLQNGYRYNLYLHYAEILQLRNKYDVFHATDFATALSGYVKSVTLNGSDMSAVVVGNFGVAESAASLTLPTQGVWYEYFSQSQTSADALANFTLAAGEYRLYTTQKIDRLNLPFADVPDIPTGVVRPPDFRATLNVFPNPTGDLLTITGDHVKAQDTVELYSLNGALVATYTAAGSSTTISIAKLPQGGYIVKVGGGTAKIFKN